MPRANVMKISLMCDLDYKEIYGVFSILCNKYRPMKKIITLTDFSAVSAYALEAAMSFAEMQRAELLIYHALPPGFQLVYELDTDSDWMMYKQKGQPNDISLQALRSELLSRKLKAQLIIGTSESFLDIESICETYQPDLIVIGATGMGQSPLELGSNTRRLIKSAKQPVLIVKNPVKDFRMDKIVFASKFDLADQEKFRKSLHLLDLPEGALIHLMSVDTASYFSQPKVLMESVMKQFETIAYPYKAVSTFFKDYNVKVGIHHFLEKVSPDILVMTHSDSSAIKRIFQADAAIESAISTSYPVLIVK